MGIKPGFSQNDVRNYIRQQLKVVENLVYEAMEQVGEQFVADARSTNTYKDQTRNLRGSIGYIIIKDGKSKRVNLEGKADGKRQARKLMDEVKAEYPRGWVLIVVAGMDYAAFVEAKGYDVLTGSSQVASVNLKRQFAVIQRQLTKIR